MGKPHFTSSHSIAGMFVVIGCLMSGTAGAVFLHPDFGVDKTNKNIRFVHKWFSRTVLIFSWFTAFMGLLRLTEDPVKLAAYGVPLMGLIFPTFM